MRTLDGKLEPWEKPELVFEGTLDEIVLLGGGKLYIPTEDTGDDPRKPKGLD